MGGQTGGQKLCQCCSEFAGWPAGCQKAVQPCTCSYAVQAFWMEILMCKLWKAVRLGKPGRREVGGSGQGVQPVSAGARRILSPQYRLHTQTAAILGAGKAPRRTKQRTSKKVCLLLTAPPLAIVAAVCY